MPYVPRYTPGQVQAADAPVDIVQNSPAFYMKDRALGQMGETVAQTGNMMFEEALQQQAQLDSASALDAVTKAKNDVLDGLQTDVYQKSGGDAMNSVQNARQITQKVGEQYRSQLTGPHQQAVFDRAFGDFSADQIRSAGKYQFEQGKKYQSSTLEGANQLINRQIVAVAGNMVSSDANTAKDARTQITTYLGNMQRNLAAQGQINGWSPEQVASAYLKQRSAALVSAADALPYGRQKVQFLEQYKDLFDPEVYGEKLQGYLKIASEENISAAAAAIMQNDKDYPDYDSKLKKLQGTFNKPEQKQELTQAVRVLDRMQVEKNTQAAIQVDTQMGREFERAMLNPTSYVPNANLPEEARNAVKAYMDRVVQKNSGIPITSDQTVYYDLMKKTPQELQQAGLSNYVNKLAPEDMMYFMSKAGYTTARVSENPESKAVADFVSTKMNAVPSFKYNDPYMAHSQQVEAIKQRDLFLRAFRMRMESLPVEQRNVDNANKVFNDLMKPVVPAGGMLWWSHPTTIYAYNTLTDASAAAPLRPGKVPDTATYDPETKTWSTPGVNGRVLHFNSRGQQLPTTSMDTPDYSGLVDPNGTPSLGAAFKPMTSLPPVQNQSGLLALVKHHEGWTPRATADGRQMSNGWGTVAKYPGEVIDQATGQERLVSELSDHQGAVQKALALKAWSLTQPQIIALTDFSFNVGAPTVQKMIANADSLSDLAYAMRTYTKPAATMATNGRGLRKRWMYDADLLQGRTTELPSEVKGISLTGDDLPTK